MTAKLVKHGMKVVPCARSEDKLKEIAATLSKAGPGKILPVRCDLIKETGILSMFVLIKENFTNFHVCSLATQKILLDGQTSVFFIP